MLAPAHNFYQSRPWLAIGFVISFSIIATNITAYLVYRYVNQNHENVLSPIQELAAEQQEEGLRALRAGNYVQAIRNLESAIELDPEGTNSRVLIAVANRLLDAKLAADRAEPTRKQQSTLLVTTTPSGLLIEIDDQPVELSPAQIHLTPGKHRVRLRQGANIRYDKVLTFSAGQSLAIQRQFERISKHASGTKDGHQLRRPQAPGSGLRSITRVTPRRPPSSTTKTVVHHPSPASRPSLLVYWPGPTSSHLEKSLIYDLDSLSVKVISSVQDFKQALENPPNAIMASTSVLKQNGLSVSLRAEPEPTGRYLAVALKQLQRDKLSSTSFGVVDELGQRRMPVFVGRLLGSSESPRIQRVQKFEDLLALLQYSIASAVIIREEQLPELQSLTQHHLYSIELRPRTAQLSVAFPTGKPQEHVTEALRGMKANTKTALGVKSWVP